VGGSAHFYVPSWHSWFPAADVHPRKGGGQTVVVESTNGALKLQRLLKAAFSGENMQTKDCFVIAQGEPAKSQFSENALKVLRSRYLQRDRSGQCIETPEELFRRVAHSVAQAETQFDTASAACEWEEKFFDALIHLDFLPNSPTLMNAGTPLSQLSACFVLPVEDSMEAIFDSLKLMALVQQSGGGVGFSFSRLRPNGDPVASTGGTASGPVSFMRIFDCATENIKQGGKRRGANMGVLRVDHPDIEEFIDAKRDGQSFRNFNLSVGVTESFMEAAMADRRWTLRHSRTGQPARTVSAAKLFARIAQAAWGDGRSRPALPGRHQPRQPHAQGRLDRGDQPLRRSRAAAIRVLQPGLHQSQSHGPP
jgi:ribonucleotide reductase alpha subunit